MNYKKKLLQYFSIVGIIVFILIIWYLNHITLYTSDDHRYYFFYLNYLPEASRHTPYITNISDIFTSLKNHYLQANGRLIAHFWVYLAMHIPKDIFNIINTGLFFTLSLLIKKICEIILEKKLSYTYLLIILLLMWFFLPELGKTIFWLSGSANYLFTSNIYIFFTYLCLSLAYKHYNNHQQSIIFIFLLIIFGGLTGNTNENSGPATLFLALLIFLFIQPNRIILLPILFGGITFLTMALSPAGTDRGGISLDLSDLRYNALIIMNHIINQYLYLIIFLIMSIVIAIKTQVINSKEKYITIIFFISSFASLMPLFLINEIPIRSFFFPSIIFIILSVIYLNKLNNQTTFIFILGSLALLYIISAISIIPDNYQSYLTDKQNREHITSQKSQQLYSCVTLKIIKYNYDNLYNPYNGTNNLKIDPTAWYNQWMAQYYNVPCIRVEPLTE